MAPHPFRLDPDHLSTYVDGELRGVRRRRLEAHLRRCEPCRRYVEQLRVAREAVAALARPVLDDALRSRLGAAFAERRAAVTAGRTTAAAEPANRAAADAAAAGPAAAEADAAPDRAVDDTD